MKKRKSTMSNENEKSKKDGSLEGDRSNSVSLSRDQSGSACRSVERLTDQIASGFSKMKDETSSENLDKAAPTSEDMKSSRLSNKESSLEKSSNDSGDVDPKKDLSLKNTSKLSISVPRKSSNDSDLKVELSGNNTSTPSIPVTRKSSNDSGDSDLKVELAGNNTSTLSIPVTRKSSNDLDLKVELAGNNTSKLSISVPRKSSNDSDPKVKLAGNNTSTPSIPVTRKSSNDSGDVESNNDSGSNNTLKLSISAPKRIKGNLNSGDTPPVTCSRRASKISILKRSASDSTPKNANPGHHSKKTSKMGIYVTKRDSKDPQQETHSHEYQLRGETDQLENSAHSRSTDFSEQNTTLSEPILEMKKFNDLSDEQLVKTFETHFYTYPQYKKEYNFSVFNKERYFGAHASVLLTWFKKFSQVFSGTPNNAQWFSDGILNCSYNCLDRHFLTNPEKVAVICEGNDLVARYYTYAQALSFTNKICNFFLYTLREMNIDRPLVSFVQECRQRIKNDSPRKRSLEPEHSKFETSFHVEDVTPSVKTLSENFPSENLAHTSQNSDGSPRTDVNTPSSDDTKLESLLVDSASFFSKNPDLLSKALNNKDTSYSIAIYMPMCAEAVFTTLACTRLGIKHNVIFGGFNAESLAMRIKDSNARIIVTVDLSLREKKKINFLANVQIALGILKKEGANCVDAVLCFNSGSVFVDSDVDLFYWTDVCAGLFLRKSGMGFEQTKKDRLSGEIGVKNLQQGVNEVSAAKSHSGELQPFVPPPILKNDNSEKNSVMEQDPLILESPDRVKTQNSDQLQALKNESLEKSGDMVQELDNPRNIQENCTESLKTDHLGPHININEFVPCVPVYSETPLFILYTSGSTGKPKGLIHTTAGYLLYAMLTTKKIFSIMNDDIFLCTADLGWITGHTYAVYGPLLNGITTVLIGGMPLYPTEFRMFESIERFKATHFYTSPTLVRMLQKCIGDKGGNITGDVNSQKRSSLCAEIQQEDEIVQDCRLSQGIYENPPSTDASDHKIAKTCQDYRLSQGIYENPPSTDASDHKIAKTCQDCRSDHGTAANLDSQKINGALHDSSIDPGVADNLTPAELKVHKITEIDQEGLTDRCKEAKQSLNFINSQKRDGAGQDCSSDRNIQPPVDVITSGKVAKSVRNYENMLQKIHGDNTQAPDKNNSEKDSLKSGRSSTDEYPFITSEPEIHQHYSVKTCFKNHGFDLSSLRMLGSVGEPINKQAHDWFRRNFGPNLLIVDTYWQTEAGGILICPIPYAVKSIPESACLPFFGLEPRIRENLCSFGNTQKTGDGPQENDAVPRQSMAHCEKMDGPIANDNPVCNTNSDLNSLKYENHRVSQGCNTGEHRLGTLTFKGSWPGIARTILNSNERYLQYFKNDFYITGDESILKNGLFYIKGRLDDVLNIAGHRLSTAEIESAACSDKHINECAVVGIHDEIQGQAIVLFVVSKNKDDTIEIENHLPESTDSEKCGSISNLCKLENDDSNLKQTENTSNSPKSWELSIKTNLLFKNIYTSIRLTLRDRIGPVVNPKRIYLLKDLPKTRTGKIMRRVMRNLLDNTDLGDLSTCSNPESITFASFVIKNNITLS